MTSDGLSLDTFIKGQAKSGNDVDPEVHTEDSMEKINEGIEIPTGPEIEGTLWTRMDRSFFFESIAILGLGGRENSLNKGGLLKVAHLVKWAEADFQPAVRHVGKGTIDAIRDALESLCDKPRARFLSLSEMFEKLDHNVADFPVTGFHLGSRASALNKAGYNTVGSLATWYDKGAPKLPNFGKTSVAHAKKIIESLSIAVDENMQMDWDVFCRHAGISLLPESKNIVAGSDLLRSIPKIIDGIIAVAADAVEADIVRDRLTRFTADQLTLDELGQKHGVTRERIRQKQMNLLRGISEGLLDDHYETAQYRFRPEYGALWRDAEAALKDQEELHANSFLEALTTTWNVTRDDLIEYLPFIFAVLTKSGSVPRTFKIYARFPQLLGLELPNVITDKPLQELQLGRKAELLEIEGIETLGELLREIISDQRQSKKASSATVLEAMERIESFIESLEDIHDFDWGNYYEFHGRLILPDEEVESPLEFLKLLKTVVLRAVENGDFHQYSREILIHRSFPSTNERLTALKVAEMVGPRAYGSTVNRNELVMNTRLKAQLVDRDFSRSPIVFRDTFLDYWKELNETYDKSDSIGAFKFVITSRWQLAPGLLDDTINLIWSILSFHPPGKNPNWYVDKKKPRKKKDAFKTILAAPPVIILRKRRTIH